MKKIIGMVALTLLGMNAFAMESLEKDPCVFKNRGEWGAQPAKSDLTLQQNPIKRILIGHTVTDKGNSVVTLQAIQEYHMGAEKKFADIGYNFCIDREGNCFECRSLEYAPAQLKGHNLGSCGVGFIGCFDNEGIDVSNEMIKAWRKPLARIAFKVGFKKLSSKGDDKNIFGMCELSETFPDSPGKKFMNQIDKLVTEANFELTELWNKAKKE